LKLLKLDQSGRAFIYEKLQSIKIKQFELLDSIFKKQQK